MKRREGGELPTEIAPVATTLVTRWFWFHHGALADSGTETTMCHRVGVRFIEKAQLELGCFNLFGRGGV
jgi:hypothetical protein